MARMAFYFALVLMVVCALASMCSCSRKVYTEQILRTDTVVQIRREVSRDTVRISERVVAEVRDSIAPVVDSMGRVVAWDRWHWRTLSADKDNHTASVANVNDSTKSGRTLIRQSVVTKATPVAWWQKALMWVGVGAICYAMWRGYRWARRWC